MKLHAKALTAVTAMLLTLALGDAVASAACPNEAFRVGPSANLPDCRAYELVTQQDTNGAPPTAVGFPLLIEEASTFNSLPATSSGNSFMFQIEGVGTPGSGGGGYSNVFRSRRGSNGWIPNRIGPNGEQAAIASAGGFSENQEFATFAVPTFEGRFSGSLALSPGHLDERPTPYILYPDGSIHLVGEGTIPAAPDTDGWNNGFVDDPQGEVTWITPDGSHIIISTAKPFSNSQRDPVQLTPNAPPTGTGAVYDRTPSGLEVVSLLPGDITPDFESKFVGASEDGSTVVFRNTSEAGPASTLYARLDNSTTVLVVTGEIRSGGVSANGDKVFYAKGANLFSFDTSTQNTTQITTTADAGFVHVSNDGSHVYFYSLSQLDGAKGTLGEPNLYVWDGTSTKFIATVSEHDLRNGPVGFGLDAWSNGTTVGEIRKQASRLTQDGNVFVFESDASPTSYDSNGHIEVYRYDAGVENLSCVSCNPNGAPEVGDSRLGLDENNITLKPSSQIENLSADGQSVLFQSSDPLLPADSNGTLDVYQWRSGQLSLISTGHDAQPSILMGATPSGQDVFIRTAEQLAPVSQEAGVPGIYDARVGGGFPIPPQPPGPCVGSACQGEPSSPPSQAVAGSAAFAGPGNQRPKRKHHRKCKKAKSKKAKQKCKARHAANRNSGGSK